MNVTSVQRHGIPLSDELRESAVDNGGHAQQIAVILDALCRSYQEATETAIEDNVEIITAGPDTYKSHQIVTEKDGGNFVVGQSFSFGSHSGEVFDSEPRYDFSLDKKAVEINEKTITFIWTKNS